jgi:hypothetical protein
MSEHKFTCEICNAYSHKSQFGYLQIIKPQQSSFEVKCEGRYYFCNEHKAVLQDYAEDERWDAFQRLKREFLDYEEYLLDPEESFVGEIAHPF